MSPPSCSRFPLAHFTFTALPLSLSFEASGVYRLVSIARSSDCGWSSAARQTLPSPWSTIISTDKSQHRPSSTIPKFHVTEIWPICSVATGNFRENLSWKQDFGQGFAQCRPQSPQPWLPSLTAACSPATSRFPFVKSRLKRGSQIEHERWSHHTAADCSHVTAANELTVSASATGGAQTRGG